MDLLALMPDVEAYLGQGALPGVPSWDPAQPFRVTPLAQGEYNLNYLVHQGNRRWVLRVNIGSQIQRDDQIVYEYNALRLLESTGVTPVPYDVDDSRDILPYGALAESYLPGVALDYTKDLDDAARLFARIHTVDVPSDHTLIAEARPLSMTFEECSRLLPVYLMSEQADPSLRDYLADVLAWAAEARHRESYFAEDPWPCVINTEVNSGNFIANREAGELHLVDWEKPLYGDPSQDLSHFCAPMTTLWKSDYRMPDETKQQFINLYRKAVVDPHLRDTIVERVRLRDPFNYLRGVSWSAMAWVTYQTGEHAVRNEDTFRKLTSYLELGFQRGMFDPYLETSP